MTAEEKANEKGEGSVASCGYESRCSAASTKMDLNEWVGECEFSPVSLVRWLTPISTRRVVHD